MRTSKRTEERVPDGFGKAPETGPGRGAEDLEEEQKEDREEF